ncbi:MAG: hypothetical protein RJA36_526 [Pseudomonadota bacterium]|jgi:phasin family protein
MLTPEQLIAAQKAQVETLFGLTQKAFEGVERLVELNLQTTRETFNEATRNSESLLSAKDAQELIALQASLMQPLAEKIGAYSRQLVEIASGTGAEFAKVAEDQVAEAQQKFLSVFDNYAKNAPAGSETFVAAMKTAINNASGAVASVQNAVKQATEMAESNFHTITGAAKAGSKKR